MYTYLKIRVQNMIFEGFGTLSFEQKNFRKKILFFHVELFFQTFWFRDFFEKIRGNPGFFFVFRIFRKILY